MTGTRAPAATRLWRKTKILGACDCWRFEGGKTRNGYGLLTVGRVTWRAHRLAWTLAFGAIPEGAQVLHKCDTRDCVNPGHLWLGTNDDNVADKMAKGRWLGLHGESNGRAVLSARQIERIRGSLRNAKYFASLYGVHPTTIHRVRRMETWTRQ